MSPPSTESFSAKSRHTRLRIKTPVGWEGKSQNDHRSGDMLETRFGSEENTNSCPREAGGLGNAPTAAAAGRGHTAQRNRKAREPRGPRGGFSPTPCSSVPRMSDGTLVIASVSRRIALRKQSRTTPRKNVPTPQACRAPDARHGPASETVPSVSTCDNVGSKLTVHHATCHHIKTPRRREHLD